jgi:hypothetical protein
VQGELVTGDHVSVSPAIGHDDSRKRSEKGDKGDCHLIDCVYQPPSEQDEPASRRRMRMVRRMWLSLPPRLEGCLRRRVSEIIRIEDLDIICRVWHLQQTPLRSGGLPNLEQQAERRIPRRRRAPELDFVFDWAS